jgi:hypothetical protein
MKAWLYLPPLVCCIAPAGEPQWRHLSTTNGALPLPGQSQQQTAALVADLDRHGVNDFVLGFRQKGPALAWYRRGASDWSRYVIETRSGNDVKRIKVWITITSWRVFAQRPGVVFRREPLS